MADQQFCLRWNNHQSTLISVFDTLLEHGTLVDCTLAAEGQFLKAHKVVLCACSPYLETLLSQHYEKHPIVILKDVKFTELKSMMDYMYRGEVNISQDQLGTFLKAAESLQIKGLSENGDGDARDVGSTPKAPPPRRATQPAPPSRPEPEEQPSPAHRSRDGSISPSTRKRRRIRRNSQGDDSNLGDSHLETSNSCDLPSQAQAVPLVPNIPATVTSSITTTPIVKTPIIKPETESNLVNNRIDTSNLNSLPPESGLLKEKIEPISEPLLEPKTEYDANNDDSVEDLTLDDDDDMDGMDISNMSNMSNMSRPGPSHGNDLSNQGFAPWHLGNQSGTDEVFMAAQEAVSAHRDSQEGDDDNTQASDLNFVEDSQSVPHRVEPCNLMYKMFACSCGSTFTSRGSLQRHRKYFCSDDARRANHLKCLKCNSEFQAAKNRKIHEHYCTGLMHDVARKRSDLFRCEMCKTNFKSEQNLWIHEDENCQKTWHLTEKKLGLTPCLAEIGCSSFPVGVDFKNAQKILTLKESTNEIRAKTGPTGTDVVASGECKTIIWSESEDSDSTSNIEMDTEGNNLMKLSENNRPGSCTSFEPTEGSLNVENTTNHSLRPLKQYGCSKKPMRPKITSLPRNGPGVNQTKVIINPRFTLKKLTGTLNCNENVRNDILEPCPASKLPMSGSRGEETFKHGVKNLTNKNIVSERKRQSVYKCKLCTFRTIYATQMQKHVLARHKNTMGRNVTGEPRNIQELDLQLFNDI